MSVNTIRRSIIPSSDRECIATTVKAAGKGCVMNAWQPYPLRACLYKHRRRKASLPNPPLPCSPATALPFEESKGEETAATSTPPAPTNTKVLNPGFGQTSARGRPRRNRRRGKRAGNRLPLSATEHTEDYFLYDQQGNYFFVYRAEDGVIHYQKEDPVNGFNPPPPAPPMNQSYAYDSGVYYAPPRPPSQHEQCYGYEHGFLTPPPAFPYYFQGQPCLGYDMMGYGFPPAMPNPTYFTHPPFPPTDYAQVSTHYWVPHQPFHQEMPQQSPFYYGPCY